MLGCVGLCWAVLLPGRRGSTLSWTGLCAPGVAAATAPARLSVRCRRSPATAIPTEIKSEPPQSPRAVQSHHQNGRTSGPVPFMFIGDFSWPLGERKIVTPLKFWGFLLTVIHDEEATAIQNSSTLRRPPPPHSMMGKTKKAVPRGVSRVPHRCQHH